MKSNKSGLCKALLAVAMALVLAPVGASGAESAAAGAKAPKMDEALARDWIAKWDKNITNDARNRYCDREMGEEIGWLVAPFLNGFYYGYAATQDPKWADRLVDWADALIKRGVKEPDGYIGWPKGGTGGAVSQDFYTDSLLGEAMALRPIVLMAGEIVKTPALKAKHGPKAEEYLRLAGQVFEKWNARGCWREVKEGGGWVAMPPPLAGALPGVPRFCGKPCSSRVACPARRSLGMLSPMPGTCPRNSGVGMPPSPQT